MINTTNNSSESKTAIIISSIFTLTARNKAYNTDNIRKSCNKIDIEDLTLNIEYLVNYIEAIIYRKDHQENEENTIIGIKQSINVLKEYNNLIKKRISDYKSYLN